MKSSRLFAVTVMLTSLFASTAHAANLLANPNFDYPISSSDWTVTGGAARAAPYIGFGYALVMREEYLPQNTWASGFQTFAAAPGQTYTFSSQVMQPYLLHPDDYGLLEIIFLTSSGQTAGVSQSDHLGLDNLPQDRKWANVSITGVAPSGTTQVTFKASFFHGCPEFTARIAFDNFIADVQPIPEPYVAGCATAVAGLGLVLRLRSKNMRLAP